MGMSRRQFVGCAAGVVGGLAQRPFVSEPTPRWGVLDLGRHCSLRESVAGYASVGLSRVLIVPAAVELPPPALRTIARCLQAGGTVLLESGAAFATAAAFGVHRDVLRTHFQIHIAAPVHLWPRGTPYVDYTWPYRAQLRDFSRVVPLDRPAGEVVAWADGLPVALKRRAGPGTLVFLGSPLGPALWAGDAEARRWVLAAVSRLNRRACDDRRGQHPLFQAAT